MSLAFFIPSLNILSRTCGFFSCAFSSSLKRSARRASAPFSEARASSSPSPDFARGAAWCAMTASSAGSMVRRPSQQGHVTLNSAMATRLPENKTGRKPGGELAAAQAGLEAGQDGLEEGVLDEADDRVDDARVGVVEGARDLDAGRDLVPRPVLQHARDSAHHAFVDLAEHVLVAILPRVVDRHVLEERFDVAGHPAVLDRELRVDREPAGRHA